MPCPPCSASCEKPSAWTPLPCCTATWTAQSPAKRTRGVSSPAPGSTRVPPQGPRTSPSQPDGQQCWLCPDGHCQPPISECWPPSPPARPPRWNSDNSSRKPLKPHHSPSSTGSAPAAGRSQPRSAHSARFSQGRPGKPARPEHHLVRRGRGEATRHRRRIPRPAHHAGHQLAGHQPTPNRRDARPSPPAGTRRGRPPRLDDLRTHTQVIQLDVPSDLPEVIADPALLQRVIVNLTTNAIQHTPPATPVLITASALGDRVELRVVDRGPGVPPEARDTIFVPFQRLGTATTPPAPNQLPPPVRPLRRPCPGIRQATGP